MRRLAALAAVGVVVAVLGVAQLVLPGLAAQRLRDQLSRSGQVLSVHVSAFPAIELLWHHADSVDIRLGAYAAASTARLGAALNQSGDAGSLTVFAREVRAGLLTLHGATLVKRGDRLSGTAVVTEADLRAALPILQSVTPVASGNGQLTVRGTASLFGVSASVDATVSARDGALVVAPHPVAPRPAIALGPPEHRRPGFAHLGVVGPAAPPPAAQRCPDTGSPVGEPPSERLRPSGCRRSCCAAVGGATLPASTLRHY